MIESWAEPRSVRLVCVTDDPLKDFATPKLRLGTVHIRRRQRIPSPGQFPTTAIWHMPRSPRRTILIRVSTGSSVDGSRSPPRYNHSGQVILAAPHFWLGVSAYFPKDCKTWTAVG